MDYVKLDFTSDSDEVTLRMRVYRSDEDCGDDEYDETEEMIPFAREDAPFILEDLEDLQSLVEESGSEFPLDYFKNILNILNALCGDKTHYTDKDIRLCWDAKPNTGKALEREVKKAVDEFLTKSKVAIRP